MEENGKEDEELAVLFHAALLGRTDVLNKVISNVRSASTNSLDKLILFISTPRPSDGCTALHIASACGHCDIVRALLVILIFPIVPCVLILLL